MPTETTDIGPGGAFIVGDQFAVGDEIVVEAMLPDLSGKVVIPAIVRWIGEGGAGVEFTNMDHRSRWAVNELLEQLQASHSPR